MKLVRVAVWSTGFLIAVSPLAAQSTAKADASKQGAACVLPKGRDVLLKLMQCCVRDLKSNEDCREYDAVNRYVIIHDNGPTKPQAYLLIPTEKVTGIDDKQIFKAPYVNLWANAWDQSERYPGWGDRRIGLAINSAHSRTQDQLHVHISCIDARVAKILDERATPDTKPYEVQLPPANNTYTVTVRNDLTDMESPFWIAREIAPGEAMGDKSVAVVKAKEAGRYFILTTSYKGGKGGSAEELLDERCGGDGSASAVR
jgi:CDP-diacylglycerol pyrophosphatase